MLRDGWLARTSATKPAYRAIWIGLLLSAALVGLMAGVFGHIGGDRWLVFGVVTAAVLGGFAHLTRGVSRREGVFLLLPLGGMVWFASYSVLETGLLSASLGGVADYVKLLCFCAAMWIGGAMVSAFLYGVFLYTYVAALEKSDQVRRVIERAGLERRALGERPFWLMGWIFWGAGGVLWVGLTVGQWALLLGGLVGVLVCAVIYDFAFGSAQRLDRWDVWRAIRRAVLVMLVVVGGLQIGLTWERGGDADFAILPIWLAFGMPIAGGFVHRGYKKWAEASCREAMTALRRAVESMDTRLKVEGNTCRVQLPEALRALWVARRAQPRKPWLPLWSVHSPPWSPQPQASNRALAAALPEGEALMAVFLSEPARVACVVLSAKMRALLMRAWAFNITVDRGYLVWTAETPYHVVAPAVAEVMGALAQRFEELCGAQGWESPENLRRVAQSVAEDPLPAFRVACAKYLWAEHTLSEAALCATRVALVEDPPSVALHEAALRGDKAGALAAAATDTGWPLVEGVEVLWVRCLLSFGDEVFGEVLGGWTHRLMARPHAQTLELLARLTPLEIEGKERWMLELLAAPEQALRQGAVWALRGCGTQASFPALHALAEDASAPADLRASARQTLGLLIERAGATPGELALASGDPPRDKGALSLE